MGRPQPGYAGSGLGWSRNPSSFAKFPFQVSAVSPPIDDLFVSLGVFEFSADQPAAIVITNRDTNGYVIIDGVQWLAETK